MAALRSLESPEQELARVDLELCKTAREVIVRRLMRLDSEGSVSASYVETLEGQLRSLDHWIDVYSRQLAE